MNQRSIPNIFAESGEKRFRELEKKALASTLTCGNPHVLSLGGGTLLDEDSAQHVTRKYRLFTLFIPFEIAWARIQNTERPLREIAHQLYEERMSHYQSLGTPIHVENLNTTAVQELFWRRFHAA